MRNLSRLLILLAMATILAACTDFETRSMKTVAAGSAFINDQAAQHKTECSANPALAVCVALARAAGGLNVAIDALEVYCGGPSYASNGQCQPNAAYQYKLAEALANFTNEISDVRSLVAGK